MTEQGARFLAGVNGEAVRAGVSVDELVSGLDRDGVVSVPGLLRPEQVAEMQQVFNLRLRRDVQLLAIERHVIDEVRDAMPAPDELIAQLAHAHHRRIPLPRAGCEETVVHVHFPLAPYSGRGLG